MHCGPKHAGMLQIVAGLEPEATNLFLQMLAMAANGQQQASKTTSDRMTECNSWQQHITCLGCRPHPAVRPLCHKQQLKLQAVLHQQRQTP